MEGAYRPVRWIPEEADLSLDGPVRSIGPSSISCPGRYPSAKSDLPKDSESTLEHDFLQILEFDRRVETFEVQPLRICWECRDGSTRRYTPDVLVRYWPKSLERDPNLVPTLFEVKYRAALKRDWKEFKPRYAGGVAWAKQQGWRIRIVTEREIRTPYLANVRLLLYTRRSFERNHVGMDEPEAHVLLKTLRSLSRSTAAALLQAAEPSQEKQLTLIPWLWRLIDEGLIGCDLDTPITMSSPVWRIDITDPRWR